MSATLATPKTTTGALTATLKWTRLGAGNLDTKSRDLVISANMDSANDPRSVGRFDSVVSVWCVIRKSSKVRPSCEMHAKHP